MISATGKLNLPYQNTKKTMNKNAQEKLLKIVRQNYTEIVHEFNETRKKRLSASWEEVIKFAKTVPDGATVLDLGCGNGRLLQAFSGRDINYLGIDFIPEIINYAKADHGANKKVKFIVGDILELDKIRELAGQEFNYIFSVAVLHHVPGEELRLKFLTDAKKYLKPEAKVFLTNWNFWPQKKFWPYLIDNWIKKLASQYEYDFGDILFPWKGVNTVSLRYYHAFTKCELKKIAKKSGLRVKKIYKDKYNYYLLAGKKP